MLKNLKYLFCSFVAVLLAWSAIASDFAGTVTYSQHIAPILYKNCAGCHHPGEVAPFSLLSFKDAAAHAQTIARVTRTRYMPPWKAEPDAGEFRDVQRLNNEEIDLIRKWVEAEMPEGDPNLLPPAPVFNDGWKLGPPDLVVTMPQAYTIPAEGKDIYQCFVVPIDIPSEKYVVAFDYKPGNRKVVHHAVVSRDNTGEAQRNDAADPDIGYRVHNVGTGLSAGYKAVLGVWTPGYMPNYLPDGVGLRLERGSVLVIQNHYHPTGKVETDRSSVGLYFAKSIPGQLASYMTVFQNKINIPPGQKDYAVGYSEITKSNGVVLAITPHMHLLGQELKLTATSPDGTVKPMVHIKNWDFNWQNQYQYATPLRVLKGTKIELEAHFDNSAENPRNPHNPPAWVRFGESTTDEMAGAILLVARDNPFTRPVANVDSKVLQTYTGQYRLGEKALLTISLEAGTLMAQVNQDKKIDLFAENETDFYSRVPDATVRFVKENGTVRVNVVVDGKNFTGLQSR